MYIQKLVEDRFKACAKYEQRFLNLRTKLCAKLAEGLHKTCAKYTQNLCKVYAKIVGVTHYMFARAKAVQSQTVHLLQRESNER